MFTTNTVTVVTAATGHRHLARCVESVRRQTFANVQHWVVVDGVAREAAVRAAVPDLPAGPRPPRVVVLPDPTGLEGWNGHRIYGAASFLVSTEFVCFLDEDNWIDPDHVESLVAAVRAGGGIWAFALRKIVDGDGAFVTLDTCESLGSLHPVFHDDRQAHIDANCYLLSRLVAVLMGRWWYGRNRPEEGLGRPDQAVCRVLLGRAPPACTNRRHTVNYTVGNRPGRSVTADFFLRGNALMRQRYPAGMPWERPGS